MTAKVSFTKILCIYNTIICRNGVGRCIVGLAAVCPTWMRQRTKSGNFLVCHVVLFYYGFFEPLDLGCRAPASC